MVAAVALLVVAVAAFGFVRLVLRPHIDPIPDRADAVVQLGGVSADDFAAARALTPGRAPELVISQPENTPTLDGALCTPLPGVRVECFAPDPSTTRGEARRVAELARERGWQHIVVFPTGEEHVERARYVFARCMPEGMRVDFAAHHPTHGALRVYQWLYQGAGWARATLTQRGC